METGYKVFDIMTNNPIKIKVGVTVKECASVMKEKNVGSLLIMKSHNLTGIITEKDIVVKIVAEGKDTTKTKVDDVMTPFNEIISIEPQKDIYDALILMKDNEIRRLPVMDGDKLLGLLTIKDILKVEPALFDLVADSYELREQERKLQNMD